MSWNDLRDNCLLVLRHQSHLAWRQEGNKPSISTSVSLSSCMPNFMHIEFWYWSRNFPGLSLLGRTKESFPIALRGFPVHRSSEKDLNSLMSRKNPQGLHEDVAYWPLQLLPSPCFEGYSRTEQLEEGQWVCWPGVLLTGKCPRVMHGTKTSLSLGFPVWISYQGCRVCQVSDTCQRS